MATSVTWACYATPLCARLSAMGDPPKELLRVVMTDELKADLEQARRATGIQNQSDLVRYCVRQVARREAAGAGGAGGA